MASRSTVLILSLLLAMPLATAAWGGFGQREPNTKNDITDGWMFTSPDTNPLPSVNKVYFASFLGQYPGTTVTPNAAILRTGFNAPVYAYWAMLGVWKDCNKDGYVGNADQGLLEYRAELLVDKSVCPPQETPSPIPLNWFPSHNDGQWVRELLPIQWLDVQSNDGTPANPDHNPWNVNDNGARVWIDEGLPTDNPANQGCWINPQPVGTDRSTGGALKWADCFDQYRVTDTFDSIADNNTMLKPYSFSDDARDQYHSGSRANVANPWGSESDGSYAQAWDCNKPQLYQSGPITDPTGGAVQKRPFANVNVSAPKVPPGVSTTGSLAGTMNATGSGFDACARNQANDNYRQVDAQGFTLALLNGHSDHVGDFLAHLPYNNEGATINQPAKTSTYNMAPVELRRTNNTAGAVLGASTPPDLGLPEGGYLSEQAGFDGTAYAQKTGLPVPSENALGAGGDGLWFTTPNRIAGPSGAYLTAYAYVSTSAIGAYGLSLPKGTTVSSFGIESCGTATTGIHNGWDCNPADWYRDANGNDITPRAGYLGKDPNSQLTCAPTGGSTTGATSTTGGCMPYGALPGSPFNLRSISCYDQSADGLRQNGIAWEDANVVLDQWQAAGLPVEHHAPHCSMAP